MINIVYLLIAIFAAVTISYFLFPKSLYSGLQKLIRLRGGMKQKSIKAGEIVWPYLEGGRGDGIPVVLLHGFGGDKDNWSIYAPYINKDYCLIAPDLPGFGENERVFDRDYDIKAQVHRLSAFLDALGIAKCHLGGNSMGGYIALQFALEYPEKLASLTLFNNAGVVGEDKSELQLAVEKGSNPLAIQTVDDVDRLMKFIAYKPVNLPRKFKEVFFNEAHAHEKLLDKIFWQIAGSSLNHALNEQLNEVKTPTLIIWGRHDKLIDVSCAKVLNDGIADSEAVIFEDAGHIPMIEKPKESAEHQLAFLAKR